MTGIKSKKKKDKGTRRVTILTPVLKTRNIAAEIRYAAETLKAECPEQFKLIVGGKENDVPLIRLLKYQKGEMVYEIIEGNSRAQVGYV